MTDVRPRKRARQSRSQATVAAIVEAAARILADGGLGAVTTNAVAKRAGVSVGSLYQYFPNREAILADLLRAKLTVLLREVEDACAASTFEQAVRRMLAALARSYIERPALAAALVSVETLVATDSEIADLRTRLGTATILFLRDNHVPEPHLAARDIVALSRGMALAAGLAGERDLDALVARMERAVHGYLRR